MQPMEIGTITGVGVGAVLGGIAVLITAIATAWVTVRAGRTIKETHAVVVEMDKSVVDIDNAVNGKKPGAQTIGEQVDDLHQEIPPKIPAIPDDAAILPLVRAMASSIEQINARLSKDNL